MSTTQVSLAERVIFSYSTNSIAIDSEVHAEVMVVGNSLVVVD